MTPTPEFLDDGEERYVEQITYDVMRAITNRGAKDAFDYKRGALTERYDSHACEYLLSRKTGLPWNTPQFITTPGLVDVGVCDEIRFREFGRASLILYRDGLGAHDKADSRYHLWGGSRQHGYLYRGWFWGYEGMQDKFWVPTGSILPGTSHRVKRGGFFIPQSALHSFGDFMLLLHPPVPEPEPLTLW